MKTLNLCQVCEMRIFVNKSVIFEYDILIIIIFIDNIIKNHINIKIDILIIYLNNKYVLIKIAFVIIVFIY